MTPRHLGFLRSSIDQLPRWTLAAAALILMLRTDRFFSPRNLQVILELASIVGVLAIGQAFVLIAGGFDLSQGATLGFAAAVAATLTTQAAFNPWLAGGCALAAGFAVGLLNGWCVAYLRTNPFVTTLSTTLIVRGLTFVLLQGRQIGGLDAFAPIAKSFNLGWIRLSCLSLVFLVVAALGWVVTRFLVVGRHLYAVGGNERAAWLSGVPARRLKLATFAVSATSAALASLLMLGFVGVSKADTGMGYELKSIAACVVGGISLQGGRGSIPGAVFGCLLLQAISSLISLSRLPDEYSTLVMGLVILVFAAADALGSKPPQS